MLFLFERFLFVFATPQIFEDKRHTMADLLSRLNILESQILILDEKKEVIEHNLLDRLAKISQNWNSILNSSKRFQDFDTNCKQLLPRQYSSAYQ